MKLVKWVVGLVIGVPLVALALVAVLLFTIDANQLKPILAKEAAKQDIALAFDGDLGWRLWPSLALKAEGVKLSNAQSQAELAKVNSAALSVAVMPLLSGEVMVDGIYVDGVEVSYLLDSDGNSQWPMHSDDKSAPAETKPPETEPAAGAPKLEIERVELTDLTFRYRGADQQEYAVEGLKVTAEDVNLSGRIFALAIAGDLALAGQPVWTLDSEMMVSFSLTDGLLHWPQWRAGLESGDAELKASGELQVEFADALAINGHVAVKTPNVRVLAGEAGVVLPETQSGDVFKALDSKISFTFADDALELSELNAGIDETELSGTAAVVLAPRLALNADLNIDKVDVDAYLAPKAEGETEKDAAPEAPPQPIPAEALQSFDANLALAIGQLTVAKIPLTDINIGVTADKGLITLKPADMTVADGSVKANVSFDARQLPAKLKAALDTKGVALATLMEQLEQEPILAGELNSQVRASGAGSTDKALIDSIKATVEAGSAQVKLSPINIERRFCEAVSLLRGQTPPTKDWAEYSELSPLRLEARYQGGKVTLQKLTASLQQLNAQSTGELDLNSGDFRFPLDVKLADFAGGLEGCVAVDEKWRERSVPLRCKGNLSQIDAKICLPDGPRITQMLKEKAEAKVKEEVDEAKDKAADKAKEELDRALDKHLDGDDKDALKESLKGLLRR